jgi:hypothetical protein
MQTNPSTTQPEPPKQQVRPVQEYLGFMKRSPGKVESKAFLGLTEPPLEDTPQDRRLVAIRMGHVRRLLAVEEEQMLLHVGDEYWISRPRVDTIDVETFLKRRYKTRSSSDKLWKRDWEIAKKKKLLSKEAEARFTKAVRDGDKKPAA